MRVLYLNPTVAIGGAERSLLELVSGVDGPEKAVGDFSVEQCGVEVEVISR